MSSSQRVLYGNSFISVAVASANIAGQLRLADESDVSSVVRNNRIRLSKGDSWHT